MSSSCVPSTGEAPPEQQPSWNPVRTSCSPVSASKPSTRLNRRCAPPTESSAAARRRIGSSSSSPRPRTRPAIGDNNNVRRRTRLLARTAMRRTGSVARVHRPENTPDVGERARERRGQGRPPSGRRTGKYRGSIRRRPPCDALHVGEERVPELCRPVPADRPALGVDRQLKGSAEQLVVARRAPPVAVEPSVPPLARGVDAHPFDVRAAQTQAGHVRRSCDTVRSRRVRSRRSSRLPRVRRRGRRRRSSHSRRREMAGREGCAPIGSQLDVQGVPPRGAGIVARRPATW